MGDEEAVTESTELEAPAAKINPITGKPWTEEDRRKQSERAKQQVAAGQLGGARHGRRKKIPAYAVIAAKAQANGSELAKELVEIALKGPTPQVRMAAIKLLTDIEQKAKQERRDDEEHLQRLPRNELVRAVIERIAEITGDDPEDFDIDLPPEDVEEVSEDVGDEEAAAVGD